MLGNSLCVHNPQPTIALQRGRVQLLAQMAQPGSMVSRSFRTDTEMRFPRSWTWWVGNSGSGQAGGQ
jgi:hypothetical protein